jgi:periplasmic protein TonB
VTQRDRPKLPLFVLAAGAILLGAAALQSVLIVGPGPGGGNLHAISIDTGRPAVAPAASPSGRNLGQDEPSQTVPSPSAEAAPAEPTDQFPTGAVPDPPHNADHAIDPAGPARAAPEPVVSAGGEPPADAAPKAEAESPSPVPAPAAVNSAPPAAEVKTGGPETPKASKDKAVAAPKVEAPPAESKPAPALGPAQVAKEDAVEAKPESVQAHPAPEDKAVAPESKVKTPSAESKQAPEPNPAQIAKSEPVEAKPEPLPAPPMPDAKPVVAEPKVEPPPMEPKPALKPGPVKVAKVKRVEAKPEPKVEPPPVEPKPALKPGPVKVAKVKRVEAKPEPKVAPVKKETATADARRKSNSKPMSLGFGRAAKPPTTAGKVSSGRYAANVRAAIGHHRPRVGSSGNATVAFSVGPAGGVQGVRIVRSSGKPQLDQAAIATVRSAAPFSAPPAGVNPTFSIQIFFR